MKNLLHLSILLFSITLFAQGEANIWYFGRNAGIDFNLPSPTALTTGALNTLEGCSSISDSTGNLLFYSNGCYIADASHQMMENGDSLNYPGEIYDNNCGNGNGYTVANGATILPHPDSSNIYYLFHVKKTFHVVSPNNFELFGYPLLSVSYTHLTLPTICSV